jgi:hypothetical protein
MAAPDAFRQGSATREERRGVIPHAPLLKTVLAGNSKPRYILCGLRYSTPISCIHFGDNPILSAAHEEGRSPAPNVCSGERDDAVPCDVAKLFTQGPYTGEV